MSNRFASGKNAIAQCDRCNFRFKLKVLKTQVLKTKPFQIKVCPSCWDPDHPQLQLGMYPVDDPQAVRNPRPDNSYTQGGLNGLQLNQNAGNTPDGFGDPTGGSRIFQWGWNPIGGASDGGLTPNDLQMSIGAGTLTVVIT